MGSGSTPTVATGSSCGREQVLNLSMPQLLNSECVLLMAVN